MSNSETKLRDALATILAAHGEKWFKFVLRMLGNSADAEDVLQEAVRRVLARGHPFPSEEQVRMYLSRAICNTAIETYKMRKRERNRRVQFREESLLACRATSPYSILVHRDECRERDRVAGILSEGLSRLPVKQYEALRMTILESGNSSIRDCSQTNGIPYSTLRHRSLQGLRRLRRFIEKTLRAAKLI